MKPRQPSQTLVDLQQKMAGFQESRVLLTAIELDLYSAVGAGSTSKQVSARLKTHPRSTEALMNALVSLGTLRKKRDSFFNTPVTARHFVKGSPGDMRAAAMHTVNMWTYWSTMTDCVRRGTSVLYKEFPERGNEWTTAFIAAMHRGAEARAAEVVAAVGVEGSVRLLDVGGGSGAYSIAFAKANPDLRAEVFDLAAVVPIARGHVRRAGLETRVKTRVGDLRKDSLGSGYGLVFVSAICHMLDPDENLDLLKRCRSALAPSGRVVIQDFILEPGKTAPPHAALFSLNMLVATRSGSNYTEAEYRAWLKQAGFKKITRLPISGGTSLIQGTTR